MADGNISTSIADLGDGSGTQGLKVTLSRDLKNLNSVTTNLVNAKTVNATTLQAGNTTIDTNGLSIKDGPTITKDKVDMGGRQIHHVDRGSAPTDAVNFSQIQDLANVTGGAITRLSSRVNRVGAGAAALSALHPLDFDPEYKWDFAAGYGNYRDANAAAVGAFYRPNEDTLLSIGGSFGGGENMMNAGISVRLGQGSHMPTSRTAMAREISSQKKQIAAMQEQLDKQNEQMEKQNEQIALLLKAVEELKKGK